MELPGSARTHVWTGLLVATVGVAVAGYAYTGDRAYHIQFVPVAVLGFVLLVAGSTLTGWGQANRPRMGGKAARRKQEAAEEDGGPGVFERAKAWVVERQARKQVTATVACPDCEHVFQARGQPPFEATCPSCGHVDRIEEPQPLETHTSGPRGPQPSKENAPARVDGQTAERSEPPPSGEKEGDEQPGAMARMRQRLGKARAGPPVQMTLACQHCDHVFTAHGSPPFQVSCPHCGYKGEVQG